MWLTLFLGSLQFSFSLMVANHFFFLLLHSLHLAHPFTFFITPLSFLFTKSSLSPFFSLHLLASSFSQTLSFPHFLFPSSSPPMVAKANKSSLVLDNDAFRLTHWRGATRLVGPPPLIYRPENHIPASESISFSFFLIFKFTSNLWFRFNFLLCKCLGFDVGWI